MFYYKKEKDKYYIWSDKIKWKFWPFKWIFCKNKYLTSPLVSFIVEKDDLKQLEKKYPWYKYSFWFWENSKIFIIWLEGIEEII